MTWQFRNDLPIYTQLMEQMKQRIIAAVYAPGERVPSVRDLAAEAGVNPNTMQRALTELEREGLMFSQRTAGRFITEDTDMINEVKKGMAQAEIHNFLKAMTDLGYSPQEIIELLKQEAQKEGESA